MTLKFYLQNTGVFVFARKRKASHKTPLFAVIAAGSFQDTPEWQQKQLLKLAKN
jgi:hypothetical protein